MLMRNLRDPQVQAAHALVSSVRAGIAKLITPHTLRHAFITAALDAGVPLRDVQEAASHADPRTTMRYDRARSSLDELDGWLPAAPFAHLRSPAEQLRRFRAREHTPFKRFKITSEDWRNRKHWNAYEIAVCDMVDRTSTEIAPWTLVEAEDKHYARIKILKTIVRRIESALEQ